MDWYRGSRSMHRFKKLPTDKPKRAKTSITKEE